MYIHGGRTEEGMDLGDLDAFRISERRWFTLQNMGPSPSPRSGHSMTTNGSKIYVLGGEPSAAPPIDADELKLMYTLDTSKIRFPDVIESVTEEEDTKEADSGDSEVEEEGLGGGPPPSPKGSQARGQGPRNGPLPRRLPRRRINTWRERLDNITSSSKSGSGRRELEE